MADGIKCSSFDDLTRKMGKVVYDIVDSIKAMNGKGIGIGIDSDAQYPNGTKVAKVARLIEYGTDRMAPRPFMRVTTMLHGKEWSSEIARRCVTIAKGHGSNYKQALEAVGRKAVNDVRKQITEMDAVDTGRLRGSIEARIVA